MMIEPFMEEILEHVNSYLDYNIRMTQVTKADIPQEPEQPEFVSNVDEFNTWREKVNEIDRELRVRSDNIRMMANNQHKERSWIKTKVPRGIWFRIIRDDEFNGWFGMDYWGIGWFVPAMIVPLPMEEIHKEKTPQDLEEHGYINLIDED